MAIGGLVIAYIMYKLLKNFRGIVFSIVFGLFISMIPTVLRGIYLTELNLETAICVILVVIRIFSNI